MSGAGPRGVALVCLLAIVRGAAAAAERAEPSSDAAFPAGSWVVQLYGGHNFSDPGKGEMWSGHLGVGYHVWDDFGLHLDAFGAFVRSGVDDDGVAGGADLIARWHLLPLPSGRGTLFADAGGGFQQASTNYSGSRHFNWRVHPGVGATVVTPWLQLLAGVRYLHISDAAVAGGGGGGFDGVYLYLGSTLFR